MTFEEGRNIAKKMWDELPSTKLDRDKITYDNWLDVFLDEINKCKTPVIDLGCGSGNDTLYLIEKGKEVIPCDFSQNTINNIIKNAHDSTKNDEIIVKLSQADEKIKISIINHGEMIEKDNQDRIFETGYTTKKDGWGIGLSVCKKFIGSQFGTFELAKSDENETIFSITLPLA